MNIESAQYNKDKDDVNCCIVTIIDGAKYLVPLDPANRHYAEILKQVEAGTLTIQEAD